jgi:hypothetical protein
MLRKLIVCGLLGPFLLAAAGCGDRNGGAVIPKETIPLPDPPVAGGAGAKKGQPPPAPKLPSEAKQ